MSKTKRNMGQGYSKERREALLSEPRFGILSISRENKGPIAVPIWHRWNAATGALHFTSGIATRKGKALVAAGRASYTVMDDIGGYVMLEGSVTHDADYDFDLELVGTAMRYMPDEGEDYVRAAYMNEGKPWPGIVLWRIKPETWLSYDRALV